MPSAVAQAYHAPVVMISGQGDVPMAVYAMKHGAFDFHREALRRVLL
jgi:FixJ family two-component response regulator